MYKGQFLQMFDGMKEMAKQHALFDRDLEQDAQSRERCPRAKEVEASK